MKHLADSVSASCCCASCHAVTTIATLATVNFNNIGAYRTVKVMAKKEQLGQVSTRQLDQYNQIHHTEIWLTHPLVLLVT